jgi:hypothetical protein
MGTPVDTGGLTREQRRSLALGRAVAEVLIREPDRVLEIARSNLISMQALHARGNGKRRLHEWSVLLNGPVAQIVDALTSVEPHARELRDFSPFAGVLSQHQRLAVLASFRAAEDADHPSA